eukprot:TRINITY_DN3336_c0_g2_i1.p1 TRINITY_DN3336_c0_g2~~TRINITY_DN3336_c0_g2_i1.p1  ORF type:complete len:196 (+),score=64.33 TRINITY_DN3336_c0_g2_i1:59-646(+)
MLKWSLLLAMGVAVMGQTPAKYAIKFETNVGNGTLPAIIVNVTTSDAPIGAAHLYELVKDGFYDEAAFFRVVPGFVVQYGIAGTPAENAKWNKPIMDDPVKLSNVKGTLTYAATSAPNSRTTQIFINYADNKNLDGMGFSGIGSVTQGMDTAVKIFNPTPDSSNGVNQAMYEKEGNKWIMKKYPQINFVTKATIV